MCAVRYTAYYQQQASAVDPYTAAAQAAYLQPAMGGAGVGPFGGGFVGSPTGFAMNSDSTGFAMNSLQLEQQQLHLMQGQLGHMGGSDMPGNHMGASGQSGTFDQLSSLSVFMSAPMNGGRSMQG